MKNSEMNELIRNIKSTLTLFFNVSNLNWLGLSTCTFWMRNSWATKTFCKNNLIVNKKYSWQQWSIKERHKTCCDYKVKYCQKVCITIFEIFKNKLIIWESCFAVVRQCSSKEESLLSTKNPRSWPTCALRTPVTD